MREQPSTLQGPQAKPGHDRGGILTNDTGPSAHDLATRRARGEVLEEEPVTFVAESRHITL